MARHIILRLTEKQAGVIYGSLWAAAEDCDDKRELAIIDRIMNKINEARHPTNHAPKDFHDTRARAWGGNL